MTLFLFLMFALLLLPIPTASAENAIHPGFARISLINHTPDSVRATVTVRQFLDTDYTYHTYMMTPSDSVLVVDIPIDVLETVASVAVAIPENEVFGIFLARQTMPLKLILNSDLTLSATYADGSDAENINHIGYAMMELDKVPDNGCRGFASAADYADWHRMLKVELDTLLPERMHRALEMVKHQPLAQKICAAALPLEYYGGRMLTYQRDAMRFHGIEVPPPPADYYKFMNDVVFDESVLCYPTSLHMPLRYLLESLSPQPIGNIPIAQWVDSTLVRIAPAIPHPTHLLRTLLPLVSYLTQIEINGCPLSSSQLDNARSYFSPPQMAFLSARNDRLQTSLLARSDLHNLADTIGSVTLSSILQRYPSRPVVIDLWATWCFLCRQGMRETEPLKRYPDYSRIEFVYISPDSSPLNEWESVAHRHQGHHFRLSEADFLALLSHLGLDYALPVTLFYDSTHTLVSTGVGYSSPDLLLSTLRTLKPDPHK